MNFTPIAKDLDRDRLASWGDLAAQSDCFPGVVDSQLAESGVEIGAEQPGEWQPVEFLAGELRFGGDQDARWQRLTSD